MDMNDESSPIYNEDNGDRHQCKYKGFNMYTYVGKDKETGDIVNLTCNISDPDVSDHTLAGIDVICKLFDMAIDGNDLEDVLEEMQSCSREDGDIPGILVSVLERYCKRPLPWQEEEYSEWLKLQAETEEDEDYSDDE